MPGIQFALSPCASPSFYLLKPVSGYVLMIGRSPVFWGRIAPFRLWARTAGIDAKVVLGP
jgi:hypothetical protein